MNIIRGVTLRPLLSNPITGTFVCIGLLGMIIGILSFIALLIS